MQLTTPGWTRQGSGGLGDRLSVVALFTPPVELGVVLPELSWLKEDWDLTDGVEEEDLGLGLKLSTDRSWRSLSTTQQASSLGGMVADRWGSLMSETKMSWRFSISSFGGACHCLGIVVSEEKHPNILIASPRLAVTISS